MVTKLPVEPYVIMSMVRRRYAHSILLLAFLWASGATPACADPQQYEGKRIANITFDPKDQPVDPSELHEILPLKIGAPLRMADVRASIARLFATGRYQDIQVDAQPMGNDVIVRFITKNAWFVGHVAVSGGVPDPPNTGQLVNATRLGLGQPFHETDVPIAIEGIQKLLVANGLYESTIDPHFDYDERTQQIKPTFVVKSDHRAKYQRPSIKGDLKMPEDDIVNATRWRRWIIHTWRPVTQTRTRKGIDRIRAKYDSKDRLMATVDLKSISYDKETRRATPAIEITAGPKVEVKSVGAKVKRKKLKEDVPIYQEHTVDRDLLEEGRRNLQDHFQTQGYFEAEVEFKEQRVVNDKEEIDYLINLGKRHKLVYVEISGNRYFTTDAIRERMFMTPASLLQFRHGRYSDALRRRDEESIVNLYKSNGFRDVRVTSTPQDDYKGKIGNIAVFVKIEEGPQWFVSKLNVTGIQTLDVSTVLTTLSSSEGQPYSEFNVASDRDTILAFYFTHGFPNATFEWSSKLDPAAHQVELQFKITEGEQQSVREVLIEGLKTTRRRLVYRNLLLNPGAPLSPIAMSDTQRRLYDLGIFAQVEMAVQNPEGQTKRKYVVYDIDEAKRYSISTGFGAEITRIGGGQTSFDSPAGATGFSPRVSFDVTRLNLWGLGHTVSFRSRVSTLQKRGVVTYVAPRIRNTEGMDLSFTAVYDDRRDVRTFSQRREEGSVQLTQRISKPITTLYRFSYRRVNVSDIKTSPLLFPRSQSVRTGLLLGNFIEDRRDDPVDARKGRYNTIEVGISDKIFGSQTNFVRFLGRNATYHRIGKKYVLAREVQFGVLPAFGSGKVADPDDPIPLPERFFSGGGNSHRGFPENQAGPRDLTTGFPLGGSALVFHNTELRFPLIGDNISGVLFHDAGNVYASPSKISFRVHQRNLTDFNYMVHAAGFGVRYRTPIGPVRLDLAYSVNPPAFKGFKGTFDELVACSGIGTCTSTTQRISRFQFFFSIGQAF